MLKSATIGELVKAVAEAQADYKALVATHKAKIPGKDGKGGYEYSYADLNDGLDALQTTLNARGVAVIQEAYTVDRGIEVVTMLALGEQWMESRPLFMPVAGAAQAVGSAITYGRRYSLFPMVGLAPADDDGAEANRNAPTPPSRPSAKARADKYIEREPDHEPADSLGPRCTGKAAGIAKSNGDRMRDLLKLRGGKASELWADVLAEAGVDVTKYGKTPNAGALTVADGTTVRDYLVSVLEQPAAPVSAEQVMAAYRRLCASGPDYIVDNWRAEWAEMAGFPEWPGSPTPEMHAHVLAKITEIQERMNS